MILKGFIYLFMLSFITRHIIRKRRALIFNMETNENQCIITNKYPSHIYCNNEYTGYLKNTEFIQNKSLIAISPGGFKGFYLLGISAFLKDHYPLDNFIYSGASAGAWNSLFLSMKTNHNSFFQDIIVKNKLQLKELKTPRQVENYMKEQILSKYSSDDFDLQRVFIGVTTIEQLRRKTFIYTDFDTLEDAIECCIASSHIPFITGGLSQIYHNKYCFDGGFSKYPYLNISKPVLYITPSIFQKEKDKKDKNNKEEFSLYDTTTLFSRDKFDFEELFTRGYQDASENKAFLDSVLDSRK